MINPMLLILPVALLLLTALVMFVLAQTRPAFRYHWLLASIGALVALVLVWVLGRALPQELVLIQWGENGLFSSSPALLADAYSWPFALALASLALAVILTDVGRAAEVDWGAWAGSLALTALGLMAVLAGNPLSLVLLWTIIDAVELIILLPRHPQDQTRESIITYFGTSLLGTLLVLLADILARSNNELLTFTVVPRDVGLILLLGVGLRLGVLPLHLPFTRTADLRRGFGTMLRLVPASASMVLLVRAATAGGNFAFSNILLAFLLLTAAYGAVVWARSVDELVGRPYWILSLAAFVFTAVLRGQAAAALAWSLALIFSGAVLFLLEESDRRILIIPVFGLLGLVALPFTPAQSGSLLFGSTLNPLILLYLPILALLIGGYLRHMLRQRAPLEVSSTRGLVLVYPLGLALLPVTHWSLGVFFSPGGALIWPGLLVIALVIGLVLAFQRGYLIFPEPLFVSLDAVFSLRWVYRLAGWTYRRVGASLRAIDLILEGEGGLLWALLVAIFLVSLIVQLGGGA